MLPARKGHFLFESGHHSELWLDLEDLFARPEKVRPFAVHLAKVIAVHGPEGICGPLVEGAFLALMVSSALQVPFFYAERSGVGDRALFPYDYRLPGVQRAQARGKRIAIVNDVISGLRGPRDAGGPDGVRRVHGRHRMFADTGPGRPPACLGGRSRSRNPGIPALDDLGSLRMPDVCQGGSPLGWIRASPASRGRRMTEFHPHR